MLLPRWKETLRRHRDQVAIATASGSTPFGELDEALAALPAATGPVVASGGVHQIVLATLRGWRDGQAVVPVETGQPMPVLGPLPREVAHVKPTPGNSGESRGILFTAGQLAADADRLVTAMDLGPATPTLAAISTAHSYGYVSVILPLLLHGIPVITTEVPFPAVVAAAWRGHPRVHLPAVPSMWRAWHRSGILADAPALLAVSAGAPLGLELEHTLWDSHRIKLHNFYGASECGGISYDASESPRSTEGDLGTPLPGVEVTLDPDQRFLVASDAVALGYQHPRGDEVLGGGRFLTPDHGHLDHGHLVLDALADNSINVAGRKLGPARVESILLATGACRRVRVAGVPSRDPERVEEVAALVETGTDIDALRAAAAQRLAGWELPRHWLEEDVDGGLWSLDRHQLKARLAGRLGR